jgi:hypothetical protein
MSANLLFPLMKFQVQEQIYDSKSMLDEQNFYSQRQGMASELTKRITYILGSYNKNYPLMLQTVGGVGFGMGNAAIEIDDVQYTYPVMGRRTKASVIYSTEYASGTPGIGHSRFYATFNDNWIKRSYIIESEQGVQAYVHSDGVPNASGGFRYELQLDPAGNGDFCPLSELNPGTRWIELNTAVAESESDTTESKMVMPGMFKNQMGFLRAGMQWAGNAANKTMRITVDWEGKQTDVWMDYAMWQMEERWLEECEHQCWYSRYNRAVDGQVNLKDLTTGKIIPRGSGVLEQIVNRGTYSSLTYNTLSNKIGDALFGQNDTAGMTIDLYTGTGGRREFHKAIIAAGGAYVVNPIGSSGGLGNVTDRFITGQGREMMLGGFFDGFYHIDGYTIKLKYNPVFDIGRVAQKSPLHPQTGLPLESYRMVFIDNGDVDGQPNIRHIAQKGRSFLDGVVKGLTPMPRSVEILLGNTGGAASKYLSTTKDKSEYTRFKSAGIQLMRANRCFDMQCTLGQPATYPYQLI